MHKTEKGYSFTYEGIEIEISGEHLIDLQLELYAHFADWLLGEDMYYVDHSDDPPWDHSGSLQKVSLTETYRERVQKMSLTEWMEETYTGNSHPTFTSGYGISRIGY